MLPQSIKRIVAKLGIASGIFIVVSIILAFAYGFEVGMYAAGWSEPWMSPQVIDAFSKPAEKMERESVLGFFIWMGDHMGYDFAGGPETTR
jgi:hypothetical protein